MTRTDECLNSRFGSDEESRYVELPSNDLDGVYRVIRNSHIFPSADAKISSLEAENGAAFLPAKQTSGFYTD